MSAIAVSSLYAISSAQSSTAQHVEAEPLTCCLAPAILVSKRYAGVQDSVLCELSKRHDQGSRFSVKDVVEQDGVSCRCSKLSCNAYPCMHRP